MGKEQGLDVAIVGSGLAGLAAARILRQHHNVTIYERGDSLAATGGQGLMLTPNAVKALGSIGYDTERAGAVLIRGFRMYDKKGNPEQDYDLDFKTNFGADCLAQKRSDFRAELLRLATTPSADLGIQGEPAKAVYNNAVVSLDAEDGIITLSDGTKAQADVVIVADGVHSHLRDAILGDSSFKAKKTGLTCYRVAVTTEDAQKALGSKPLPHWWEPSTCQNRSSMIAAAEGDFRMVVMYPICNHTAFNISCIVRTEEPTDESSDVWHVEADRGKMLEIFSDFDESFVTILSAAREVKVWELQDLETLPTWTRGRSIIIGDAAHAMTPMQGQGANMAIEDAEAMRLLTGDTQAKDVPDVLKKIDSFRRPRTAQVLAQTRNSHKTLDVGGNLLEGMKLVYSYNGIHEAIKAAEAANEV